MGVRGVGLVLVIDVARTSVSLRTARRFHSAALLSNALHFGSDFAGSLAVLVGLIAPRRGWPAGDSVAALFVAALVLSAAVRLMRRNVDVLMDRAPADAEAGGAPGDRGDRAADPAEAAADALGGGPPLRRRRDRGLARGGGRAGSRRRGRGRGGGRAGAPRDRRRRPRRADGGGRRHARARATPPR